MIHRPLDMRLLEDIWRVYGGANRYVRGRLDARGVCSLPQWMVLSSVFVADAAMAPTDVAAWLGCSRANVAQIVVRLEKVGWITKVRHPRDARVLILALTPKGRDVYDRGLEEILEAARRVLAPLKGEQKDLLFEILQKVTAVNLD
jgi:DNA-binding MarR family transcriptional regulator